MKQRGIVKIGKQKKRREGNVTHHEAVNKEVVGLEGGEGICGEDSIPSRLPQLHRSQKKQKRQEEGNVEDLHGIFFLPSFALALFLSFFLSKEAEADRNRRGEKGI